MATNIQASSTLVKKVIKPSSPLKMAVHRFTRNPLAVVGLIGLVLVLIVTIGAPLFTHYNPYAADILNTDAAPSPQHIFGTDGSGYDNFTRLLYGGRTDLTLAFVAALCVMFIGTIYGGIAGFFGGWIDNLMMRFVDIMLNFPTLLLIIVLESILNAQNVGLLITVIAITAWPGAARLMRGVFLQLRQMDYVIGAETIGCSKARIIMRHMLPNSISVLAVLVGFAVSGFITISAGLALIGMGLPVITPSWGSMLAPALNFLTLTQQPWVWIPPAVMIIGSILCINFIADGLRDALDPTTLG